MLYKLPKPAIIAHRGASLYAPENTLPAFQLAILQGADAIELDVKLSADGQVVVIHDQTIDRTTGEHGRVRELSLEVLQSLDAGSHFDIVFQGAQIPTLAEVFDNIGQRSFLNIELTNYDKITDNLPEKVADLINSHNLRHRILLSSSNPIALVRIYHLLREVPIGLLTLPGKGGAWARSFIGKLIPYSSLHCDQSDVTTKLVSRTQAIGKKLFAYTVNREEDIYRMFTMGVDGIFTGDPILAKQIFGVSNY
jgi:glycerophosphoryl diester phosphodiesterase